MAKVTGPLQSNEARGGIGALIFNSWRGISTVKMFTSPSQPRSARQLAVRAFLATCARAWAALTTIQRASWTTWANDHPTSDWTGQMVRQTGANAYTAHSTRLLDMGLAAVATAPVAAPPAAPAGLALTPGTGSISIAWTAYGGTATKVDGWLYGPFSPGRTPKIQKARHNFYQVGETSPKALSGLAAGHYAVFLRAISETDGGASCFVMAETDVT